MKDVDILTHGTKVDAEDLKSVSRAKLTGKYIASCKFVVKLGYAYHKRGGATRDSSFDGSEMLASVRVVPNQSIFTQPLLSALVWLQNLATLTS